MSGLDEKDAREWVKGVIEQVPRLSQLLFQLPELPPRTHNTTGIPPRRIGDVSFQRFTWTRTGGDRHRADAVVDVSPGRELPPPPTGTPYPTRVRAEITVDFGVQESTAPYIFGFFWKKRSLDPVSWTLHRVDGRVVEESAGFSRGTW